MRISLTILSIFLILSFLIPSQVMTFENEQTYPINQLNETETPNIILMDIPLTYNELKIIKPLPTLVIQTPDVFNWKDKDEVDWTTPAKHQGNCGSCWDFAAIGTLESIIKIRENNPSINPDLSEQYVLSCLPAAANNYAHGCSGGTPYNAFNCMMNTSQIGNYCNGAIPETCMPYQADDSVPCEDKCENWEECLIPILDCGEQWLGFDNQTNRDIVKSLLFQHGPIASGINVSEDFIRWGSYHHRGSDYYPNTNEPWGNHLNHIIVIVGWNDDPSIENGGYWICKNSWGTEWGYDGFFNIEYGGLFTATYIAWVDYTPINLRPLQPETPAGPTNGIIDTEYTFSTVTVDPEGDQIYYLFDWGDGTQTEWLGPYESNVVCEATHSWEQREDWDIKVKAKDVHEYESEWSEPLEISMPKARDYNPINQLILKMLERFPFLQTLIS